jgi:hypothetical protein
MSGAEPSARRLSWDCEAASVIPEPAALALARDVTVGPWP